SIGVLAITPDWQHVADVLSAADSACYSAKLLGRNRVHVYRDDDSSVARRDSGPQWLGEISSALAAGSLLLSCQPIMPLAQSAQAPVCYELLVRIENGQGRLVEA